MVKLSFRLLLLALIAWLVQHLFWVPWYEFPEARPFHGSRLENPYQDYAGTGLRANFHAHSQAWVGLTYGTTSVQDIYRLYQELGYQSAAISNYQRIAPPPDPELGLIHVPAYEHTLSLGQQHHTVLGAPQVSWFDYTLWQTSAHKQHVIDVLTEGAPVVILNHPRKGAGFSLEDMAVLSGYTGLEVMTKYSRGATEHWDAALSAGRRVFGFASDDGHRQDRGASHIAIGWVIIHGCEPTADSLLASLQQGRFHAVWDRRKTGTNRLLHCRIQHGVVEVEVERRADRIVFIGQGGVALKEMVDVKKARLALEAIEHYVRVEVWNEESCLYLNPITRYEKEPVATLPVPRSAGLTHVRRGLGLLVVVAASWMLLVRRTGNGQKTRRAPPAGAPPESEPVGS